MTRSERVSQDLELPNSGNEDSEDFMEGLLEEGWSRRRSKVRDRHRGVFGTQIQVNIPLAALGT